MEKESDTDLGADEMMTDWEQAPGYTERMPVGTAEMDALPAAEREALLLWNGGMDYREIAERTRLSLDDVGLHLARARERLAPDGC